MLIQTGDQFKVVRAFEMMPANSIQTVRDLRLEQRPDGSWVTMVGTTGPTTMGNANCLQTDSTLFCEKVMDGSLKLV